MVSNLDTWPTSKPVWCRPKTWDPQDGFENRQSLCSGCLMWRVQTLDGSKPISRVCCREEDLLWREVSHGALLLLYMCFSHGSPPPHQSGNHLRKMCVSRAELTCSARMQKAFRWQTSPRAAICHWEQRGGGAKRKEGTAALRQQRDWQGKKEGVRNGATVLGIQ